MKSSEAKNFTLSFQNLSLLALVFFGSSCSRVIEFQSAMALSDGVRGRAWGTSFYLDQEIFSDQAQDPAVLLTSFDAAASGNAVQVIANWRDEFDSIYRGYSRLYTPGSGWASPGAQFKQIAGLTTSFSFVSLTPGSSQNFVAHFFGSTATSSASALYSGASWRSAVSSTLTVANGPEYTATDDLGSGPRVVTAMDRAGRVFAFYTTGTQQNSVLRWALWQSGNPNGYSSPTAVTSASLREHSNLDALYDGSQNVCVAYEASDERAYSRCVNLSTDPSLDFSTATEQSLSTETSSGVSIATDGSGNMMSVYAQFTSEGYRVFAREGENGVWSDVETQIDSTLESIALTPPPGVSLSAPGLRPTVTHVGGGAFLSVWVGRSDAAQTTALYSSLYQSGSWSTPTLIEGTIDTYTTTPHPRSLVLFSNGNKNAGFALNQITLDSDQASNVYSESDGVRNVRVARWHLNEGWLTSVVRGKGCTSTDVFVTEAECTHRPQGVILPNGESFVFSIDRDDQSDGTSPGNRRLLVTPFQ